MKTNDLIILLSIFLYFSAFAQHHVTGSVKSNKTNKNLPYVNLGVLKKGKGTVTNEEGAFYLLLQDRYLKDSICISMIGYKSKTLVVSEFIEYFKSNESLFLEEKIEELNEVVISSNKKWKERILGNRSKSRKNLIEASSDLLGSEIGLRINIKRSPTYINAFHTKVLTKKHKSFKFRLNFYTVKDDLPHENILNQGIIITSEDIKDGFINFNLEPYDIVVDDDFFVTLEWIENKDDKKLQFPASIFGNRVVERKTSHSAWEKAPIGSIGFNVKVTY